MSHKAMGAGSPTRDLPVVRCSNLFCAGGRVRDLGGGGARASLPKTIIQFRPQHPPSGGLMGPPPRGVGCMGLVDGRGSGTHPFHDLRNQFSQKSPQALHVLNHGWWRLAVGGWRRLAVGGWRLALATGGWWRLVVVGGGWWLVAVGSGWRLAVGRHWRLAAVGGWWLVAVGS